jgi:hypothetical protein
MANDGNSGHDARLFSKTASGRTEIDVRSRRLPPVLRAVLLLVDGQRDASALRALAAEIHAPADALEQLAAMSLIAATPEAAESPVTPDAAARRVRRVSSLMAQAVQEHLGVLGFFMQRKIERCTHVAELEALLPDVGEAVARARGFDSARQWERGVRLALAG